MEVLKFNDDNFKEMVLDYEGIVLVDFYAEWCGPCKMQAPIIEDIANEAKGNIRIGKVNVDENPNISEKYGIMSIPTFLIIKDGDVKNQWGGLTSKSEILDKLK